MIINLASSTKEENIKNEKSDFDTNENGKEKDK